VANALSTDPEFATKLTSIANYVNNIDANNLFSLAQSLGVGVKDNYETTKNMVCAKMLNDEMEKEKTRANEKIQSQSAELFLTKKTIDE
jgi:CO dehydrogenase nickel-insertion accessory protein CooC1